MNAHRARVFSLALLLTCVWVQGASAQESLSPEEILLRSTRPGLVVEVRRQLLSTFGQIDANGDGVYSADDAGFAVALRNVQLRSSAISRWLRYDLDGDAAITAPELEAIVRSELRRALRHQEFEIALTSEQISDAVAQQREKLNAIDADRDGRLTFAEIGRTAVKESHEPRQRPEYQLPRPIDANADGRVTREEFAAAVDKMLAEADADRNGTITPEEAMRAQQQAAKARSAARARATMGDSGTSRADCKVPKPADSDYVAFVGVHSGATVTNVSLGVEGREARIVDVEIEDGGRPIYAVVSSIDNVIWRFSGAAGRVSRVLVIGEVRGGGPFSGVVGVPRDRVTIVTDAGCARMLQASNASQSMRARAALAEVIARNPEKVTTAYRIAGVALPSGRTVIAPPALPKESEALAKAAPATWQYLTRLAPGGVRRLDPDAVVAVTPVAALAVLPETAGLIELIGEGKLAEEGTKTLIVLPNGTTIDPGGGDDRVDLESLGAGTVVQHVPLAYRILKPIEFPKGLTGGHAVTFILPKGVPRPTGSPGHSCVIDEATGNAIVGDC